MAWTLQSAIVIRPSICEIVFTDGSNTVTSYSYRIDGESDTKWHSRIKVDVGTDLSNLNVSAPPPVDITEIVK
jgi:hypothetical protein